MKKIVSILLATFAFLSLVPFAIADGETEIQQGPDYYLNNGGDIEEGAIGFKKSISKPDTEGKYWITLESFATGESVKVMENKPADIVLVLDVSGSMNDDMSGNTTNNDANRRITILKNAVNTFLEEINRNDIYEVYDKDNPANNKLRQTRLGNRVAIVAFSGPSGPSDNDYTYSHAIKKNTGWRVLGKAGDNTSVTDTTGLAYLRSQVNGLTVGGATFSNYGMQAASTLLSNQNSSARIRTAVMFTDGNPGVLDNYWTDVEYHSNRYVLSNYAYYTWWAANGAIENAKAIKDLATDTVNSSVYSVSIITDSKRTSYTDVYLDQVSSNYPDAEYMAVLKTTGNWNTYYYIENWNRNQPWTSRSGSKVSSDYSFATTSADELKAIFQKIGEDSGGGSSDLGETTIAEVDVVSASFTLPPNANTSSIEVYFSKCEGMQAPKQYIEDETIKTGTFLQFGTPKQTTIKTDGKADPNHLCGLTYEKRVKNADNTETVTTVPVDANLTVALSASDSQSGKLDKIEINGFDYGGNWCGPKKDENGNITGWNGHKLIVKIPVMMDPEAVGGPNTPTNVEGEGTEGSGIYIDGKNVAPFVSPKVSLPVNLWIRKEGLEVGESAKFTVQRKKVIDNPNLDSGWDDVTSVFVTRHQGNDKDGDNAPITKITGMPSTDENNNALVYRIVEDDWGWSYNSIVTDDTTPNRSDLLVTNPFVFANQKKTDIDIEVRHAESKATNTFKNGNFVVNNKVVKKVNADHVGYDDSKNNNREVITIENSTAGGTE